MDAALVTAIGALLASPVAAAAAMYGTRGATRAQREGGVITGYDSLTDQLQEERKEMRQQLADLRAELSAERVAKAQLEAEASRLRLLVQQLGGTP
jgi:hypothetical protein